MQGRADHYQYAAGRSPDLPAAYTSKELRMHNRSIVSLGVSLVFCLSLVFSTMIAPRSAAAGQNGQQVRVYFQTTTANCGGGYITGIRVSGTNHSGNPSTWSTPLNLRFCGSSSAVTYGYWFKGLTEVVLTYQNFTGGGSFTKTCRYNIPTVYSSDIYAVSCNA